MRRSKAVEVEVKQPSRGLITRAPSDFANPRQDQPNTDFLRAATEASNVRFEEGVATNAPGYERIVICPALDSPALLLHQANLIGLGPFDARACLIFTQGEVSIVQRTSRQLDSTAAVPADCGSITPTAPGTLQLSAPVYSVSEGAGQILIPVQRVSGSNGVVAVSYLTQAGTAVAGTDYTAVTGTLTWLHGESADQFITVPILEDVEVEGNQTFTVVIYNPTNGAVLGSPSAATVTIIDND